MEKTVALITAAGSSIRMAGLGSKPFLMLGQIPLIVHTIRAFETSELIDDIFLVLQKAEIEKFRGEVGSKFSFFKMKDIVPGGRERQESVKNGLEAIGSGCDIVAIHDGVRPFVRSKHIDDVVRAAREYGASTLAVRAKDTIKLVNKDGLVEKTLDRNSTWQTQTPQAFKYKLIRDVHQSSKSIDALDDALLVEKLGYKVKVIEGDYANIKITTPEDLTIAESLLKNQGGRI